MPMPSEHSVQLSSAQKRDLLGMSAAAVITTALIAAPILLPHDFGIPQLVVPSIITAGAVPAPALIQAISPSTLDTLRAQPVAAARTSRHRERPAAAASPVRLASRSMATSAPVLVAVNTTTVRPPSKPLGKRIAGLFTGDGTYSVRPFPTIATERQ